MQNQFLSPETSGDTTLTNTPPATMPTIEVAFTAETMVTETVPTAAATQAVTQLLAQAQRRVRRRKKKMFACILALYAIFNVGLLLPGLVMSEGLGVIPLKLLLMESIILLLGIAVLREIARPVKINLDELARLVGKAAIPVLMEARGAGMKRIDFMARRSALIACLPQLQASDAALLTATNRRYLNEFLRGCLKSAKHNELNQSFALAILKTYEQVGDAEAIPVVAGLANSRPRNERQKRIQEAAQECLPLLQAHVGNLRAEQTLLRAASSDTAAPDILLRPAASTTFTPDNELLRATEHQDVPPPA